MLVEVGSNLIIKRPTEEVKEYVKRKLNLVNPDYYSKINMGHFTGNTPRKIALYIEKKDELILPFGCFQDIYRLAGVDSIYDNKIKPPTKAYYESNINLYAYQEKAVESAIRAKNGVIIMPCGAGKTQTALELIARLGLKTLWITHTTDLLEQSYHRAKENLMPDRDGSFGKITKGKIEIGSHITFSTIQTLIRLDLNQLKDEFSCIIVDECHKCVGAPTKVMMFYKVLSNLSARYKYGITATPNRQDGLEASMYALLGNPIYEVSKEAVKENTVPVSVCFLGTNYKPNLIDITRADGTIDYTKAISHMVLDESRNSLIANFILRLYASDSTIMVLSDRVAHLDVLNRLVGNIGVVLSAAKGKDRNYAIEQIKSNKRRIIFATYALAKEGLDIPNLTHVILATPRKDETTVIQSVGRVSRKSKNKIIGTAIDFVDDFAMYKNMANKRKRAYVKAGYLIKGVK